jgi:phosphatidylserine decarboxylase
MDDPASKAYIRKFVKSYKGQLDISEIERDLDSFETFNEFFYRRLKPGSRPISHPDDDGVFVSAADCRFMAFDSVDNAKQFWIKV